jgi:hypothetical protein
MEDLKNDTKYIDDVDVQKNETVFAPEAREAYGPAGQRSTYSVNQRTTTDIYQVLLAFLETRM